jgi:hypothetical protein
MVMPSFRRHYTTLVKNAVGRTDTKWLGEMPGIYPQILVKTPFLEAHMGKKLYVGNLTYGVTDSNLLQMFEPHGTVQSAQVIMDRDTGRSKGFGFVEMGSDQEAQAAIAALNGKEVDGRSLTVNEAKPRTEGGGGRGGSGGGRGGYGGGGGRRY